MQTKLSLASSWLCVLLVASAPAALAQGTPSPLEPFPSARVGAWVLPGIAFLSAEGILHGVASGRLGGADFVTQ